MVCTHSKKNAILTYLKSKLQEIHQGKTHLGNILTGEIQFAQNSCH